MQSVLSGNTERTMRRVFHTLSDTQTHTPSEVRTASAFTHANLTTAFLVQCVSTINDLITPGWCRNTDTVCTTSLRGWTRGIWNQKRKKQINYIHLKANKNTLNEVRPLLSKPKRFISNNFKANQNALNEVKPLLRKPKCFKWSQTV